MIIVWDLKNRRRKHKTELLRPSEEYLLSFTDDGLKNYSEDHILNTDKAVKRQSENKNVCCFHFLYEKIYTGYEDGLICCWSMPSGEMDNLYVGHTN